MKRIILMSAMMLMAIVSFGHSRISEKAKVVSDTIYYAANSQSVKNAQEAAYYRILKTQGSGMQKEDVFQDYYMNGNLRAEGGYSFIDLSNDKNTMLNGEVTTYYQNGKEKLHGTYVNGKRNGYFTLQLRDGSVAVVAYDNGKSRYNYFMVTLPDGTQEKRPLSDIKKLLD
jgi:antitoxin component YwqK of YwqJK toxin-antitoxin module